LQRELSPISPFAYAEEWLRSLALMDSYNAKPMPNHEFLMSLSWCNEQSWKYLNCRRLLWSFKKGSMMRVHVPGVRFSTAAFENLRKALTNDANASKKTELYDTSRAKQKALLFRNLQELHKCLK
jgi:hypothetical protein